MARKPAHAAWLGVNQEQAELLDVLNHIGNNGWARNNQSEALMPRVLTECAETGLSLSVIKHAMASGDYSQRAPRGGSAAEPRQVTHGPAEYQRHHWHVA